MKQKGLTASVLASRMKGDPDNIEPRLSLILNGKAKNLRLEAYHAIANGLGVRIEEILGKDYWKKY